MVFLRVPSCPLWFSFAHQRSINHEGHEGTRSLRSLATKNLFRSNHRVAVDRDRIFHTARIAAGERHHHWNVTCSGYTEHQFVAPLESFNGERQSAKLIFAIRIGAGNVAN